MITSSQYLQTHLQQTVQGIPYFYQGLSFRVKFQSYSPFPIVNLCYHSIFYLLACVYLKQVTLT